MLKVINLIYYWSFEHVTALYNAALSISLQIVHLFQNHLHLLLFIKNVVCLSMILSYNQSSKIAQNLCHIFPIMILLESFIDSNSVGMLLCLGSKIGFKQSDFPCKPGIQNTIQISSHTKYKCLLLDRIQKIEHSNESTPSHIWIKASIMTILHLEIMLHIFEVDICISLQ